MQTRRTNITDRGWEVLETAVRNGRLGEVTSLLRENNYSTSYVEQFVAACEEYNVIHVDGEILSQCSSEQKDRLLKTAVKLCEENVDRWNDVKIVLQNSNYSSSSVEQFVAACEQYQVIHVDGEILSRFSSEQKGRLLETAVKVCSRDGDHGDRWNDVNILLQDSNYSSRRVKQFVAACEQYGVIHVDPEILSHCSSEQKDRLLKTAVSKGSWEEVDSLLQDNNYSSSSVELCVTACQQYGVKNVDSEILSHCSSEQKDRLLKTALKLCKVDGNQWNNVKGLLQNTNYSSSSVEQFVAACEQYGVIHVDGEILSHCSSEHRGRLLKTALTLYTGGEDRWNEIKILVQDSNYSSSTVEQFVSVCERYNVIYVDREILSHCSSEQRDRLLKTALKLYEGIGNRWNEIKILLQDRNYSSSTVEQFVTACEQYKVIHVDDEILSHCSSVQKYRLLQTAIYLCRWHRGQWNDVKALLQDSNYSSSGVEQFVTVCDQYNVIYVDGEILSHCSSEQRDCLLKTAINLCRWSGGSWNDVKALLQDSNYSSSSVEQFVTVCDQYNVIHVDGEILSHCSSEQKDRLLKTALKLCWGSGGLCKAVLLERWRVVKILLQDSYYSSSSVEQFVTACEQYERINVDQEILSHCSSMQRDRLLKTAVKLCRRSDDRWNDVKGLLQDSNYSSSSVQQFVTACEEYVVIHVDQEILSHCNSEQLNRLLETATKVCRNSWNRGREVEIVLQYLHYSSSSVEQFVTACEHTEVIHVDGEILSQCSSEQKDRLLKTALTLCRGNRDRWNDVKILLHDNNYSSSYVEQIVSACQQYEVIPVDHEILSHCSSEQKDRLLKTALKLHVPRRSSVKKELRWSDVRTLLQASNYSSSSVDQFVKACGRFDVIHVDRELLSHCTTQQLDRLLILATTLKQWDVVGELLKAGGSHEKRVWVIEQARKTADHNNFEDCILPHVEVDFLSQCTLVQFPNTLLSGGFEDKMSERGVSAKSRMWAMTEACKDIPYPNVMRNINNVFGSVNRLRVINFLSSKQLSRDNESVAFRFALQEHRWDVISRGSLSQVWEQVRRHLFREAVYQRKWTLVKKWADHTLYDDERWWALEETYKHKQWDVMLQLSDHGLTEIELMRVRYRLAKHADWDVVLQMFDRGVDVTEVREVLESTVISRKTKTTTDRATQQALALRWRQLRQLEEKLTRASARRLELPSTALQWRTVLFHLHRHPGTASVPSRSQPGKTFGGLLLQRAIENRLWHVVMHLVTLGLDTNQLDSLLTDMTRRRQWGVCRVLLEQGVSVQSCLSALSVFMEKNQWTLVARLMEFIVDDALKHHIEQLALNRSVGRLVWQCVSAMCRCGMRLGDAVRLQVMQRAMERREGSVVGECISTLQHYRLSVKEREELFQQAIIGGVLQAVKPLVEEKDETETKQRDATMLAAIEQRQWDVVDCCQLQGVNIDMKDERGETPLNREVNKITERGRRVQNIRFVFDHDSYKIDWKAVEELLVRGADPNVLDKDGWSVLNRAIGAKQWDIVRLLIECLGDIHKEAKSSNDRYQTPLQLLIDERQGEIIHHTLIWCPDQTKGVNDAGETTLHAIALDKRPEMLYYQIVRGVNPLTLTKEGHSVLFYAVLNEHCPQRMAGECIKLGFSTHQPPLIRQTTIGMVNSVTNGLFNEWKMTGLYGRSEWYYGITSPFLLAVLRGLPVVAHMLYESGSCSYPELLHVYTMLLDLSDSHTEDGRKLLEGAHLDDSMRHILSEQYRQRYEAFMNTLTTFLPYLGEMASTPRSLVSTCRLVISHCLTVRRRRERDVQDLSLSDRMKNYLLPLPDRIKDFLLFSDLTHPDYQWFLYGTLPPLTPQKGRKGLKRKRSR